MKEVLSRRNCAWRKSLHHKGARIGRVECAENATLGGARTVMGRSERSLAHVKNSSIKIQEFNCLVQTGFRSCWMMTCVFCTSPLFTYRLTTESSPDLCESLTILSATMGCGKAQTTHRFISPLPLPQSVL